MSDLTQREMDHRFIAQGIEYFEEKAAKSEIGKWWLNQVKRVFNPDILPVAPKAEPVTINRERLADLIAEQLAATLHCSRVWEAWQYGTMSQHDFSLAGEDNEFVSGISDAVIAHLAAQPVTGTVEASPYLTDSQLRQPVTGKVCRECGHFWEVHRNTFGCLYDGCTCKVDADESTHAWVKVPNE